MKELTILLLSGMLLLTGCEEPEPGTYPIMGEPCSPDDPVHRIGADCMPPV